MTPQDGKFSVTTPYTGFSSVVVGDATLLPIKSTSNVILKTTGRPLQLSSVMFLP